MELVIGGASLAVVIIVIMEALKKVGLQTKFIPVLSLGLGIIGGVVAALTSEITMVEGVIGGLLAGAAASGLYDNATVPFKKPDNQPTVEHVEFPPVDDNGQMPQ